MTDIRRRTVSAAIGLLLASAGVAASQEIADEFRALADRAVPEEVGDAEYMARLLAAEPREPQLSRAFKPAAVMEAVRDTLKTPEECDCPAPRRPEHPGAAAEDWRATNEDGSSVLKASLERGRVTYLNRNRSFQAARGASNEVSEEQAQEIALRTARAFGVPLSEVDRERIDVQTLMATARDRDARERAVKLRAEVHVRAARVLAGVPVFDSGYQVAIGVGAEVARVHVRWPDFALARGLSPRSVLSRRQVVDRVARELADGALPKSWRAAVAQVVFARATEVGTAGPQGDEAEAEAAGREGFVPALAVYALPPDPEEDSGQIVSAGRQFLVPLLGSTADAADREQKSAG